METTSTMVADAVVDKVHQKIFEKITARKDIPEEYGTREEMMYMSTKFQVAFKEQMKMSRLVKSITLQYSFLDKNNLNLNYIYTSQFLKKKKTYIKAILYFRLLELNEKDKNYI